MAGPFAAFETTKGGTPAVVPVRVRDDVSAAVRDDLVAALNAVPWHRLHHAYGPADDVAVLLYAVTLGEREARAAAWWELWGNVHHQSTVYEATVYAVPFVAAVAGDDQHPDRVQALSFLRELAVGSGRHATAVRDAVRPCAQALLTRAATESALVRRALAWLLSAFPELVPSIRRWTSSCRPRCAKAGTRCWNEFAPGTRPASTTRKTTRRSTGSRTSRVGLSPAGWTRELAHDAATRRHGFAGREPRAVSIA